MPQIGTVDLSQVDILPKTKELLREVYLQTIQEMISDGKPRQLVPDEGETLRKMRVNLTRSANDFDVRLIMHETRDGTLVVQLDQSPQKVKKSRAPRVVAGATNGASSLELPDDEDGEEEPKE